MRKRLIQVGLTAWIAPTDIVAIDWDPNEGCPRAHMSGGAQVWASSYAGASPSHSMANFLDALTVDLGRRRAAEALAAALAEDLISPKELEVLNLISDGDSVHEIGKVMYISDSTVKAHISGLYDKLGAHNRAGVIMAAIHRGILAPEKEEPE